MQNAIQNPSILELLRFTEVHQRHTEALVRATGARFNIFQILRVGHLEVKTHSPILGELLNPKGKHGQGASFLRLFLARFKIIDFDAEAEKVALKLEHSFARKGFEKSAGRIDIVITDGKGGMILIENKIYAGDQQNQIKRYRDRYPAETTHLFYLTLNGDKPSNLLEGELDRLKCKCISYEKDILAWLKECRKEAACLPSIREIITQYIHLIEKLTNQSTTTMNNNDLINKIVESKDSLDAFFTLREEENAVQTELIFRLDKQLDSLAKDTAFKRQGTLQRLSQKFDGFYFLTPGLDKCNLRVGFEFEGGDYKAFFFGFGLKDFGQPCPVAEKILSAFENDFGREEPTRNWPAWAWWGEHQNWGRETFEAIRSGKFADELKPKLEKLAKIARQVCPD